MLSITDTALDFLVLQFVLHASSFSLLLLSILAPVCAWPENDVLSNGRSISCRSRSVLSRESKLGPLLALRNSWVYNLTNSSESYPAGSLDLFAIIVQRIGDYCLGAIFVCGGSIWWEAGGDSDGIIEVFIIGPIWPAVGVLDLL